MEGAAEIKTVFWIGTFLMLFLTLGLVTLAVTYQQHFFKVKKKEAESMLKACLETEKQERERIAADLHDGVLGDLMAIKNYINILKTTNTDSEHVTILNEVINGVDDALESTRTISYNLMPPLLQTQGFIAAIDNYYNTLSKKTGIIFTVSKPAIVKIDLYVSYHLFRIVQELTTNMVKHGNITKADITIDDSKSTMNLTINDNGIPFSFTSALHQSSGNGLNNITTRLQVIHAMLVHKSNEGTNNYSISLKKNHA